MPTGQATDRVSDRFASQFVKAVKAAVRQYSGGRENLELVLDDPDFTAAIHRHWDERAAARRLALAPQPSLLEFITTTELRALPSFAAADHYRTENTPDGVKLGWIGQNFRQLLATDGSQPIELPGTKIRILRLKEYATTAAIVAAVGDSGRFPDFATAAAAMWAKLAEQLTGESGDLLLNGFANIFPYPEGAVDCYWDADYDGWYVGANLVSISSGWGAGHRVFSPADSPSL